MTSTATKPLPRGKVHSDGSQPALVIEVEPDGTAIIKMKWRNIIVNKLKAAYARAKRITTLTGRKTKNVVISTAKTTAHVVKETGKGGLWLVTGTLNVAGRMLWHVGRFGVHVLLSALRIAKIVDTFVLFLFYEVCKNIVFLVHRVVYFLTLVICSPWIALHSWEAAKTDWNIFAFGLKPRNWSILRPTELAKKSTMEEHEREAYAMAYGTAPQVKTEQRMSSAAPPEGQSPASESIVEKSARQRAPGKSAKTQPANARAGRIATVTI